MCENGEHGKSVECGDSESEGQVSVSLIFTMIVCTYSYD